METIATPFTVMFESDTEGGLIATSPQHPQCRGASSDPMWALQDLIEDIKEEVKRVKDAVPFTPAMVAALRAAGHSDEDISMLDWTLVGSSVRHLRYDSDCLIEALAEYARVGVPAALACRFMITILSVEEAGRVHAAGREPEEVLPYVRESHTYAWYEWDFDYVEWMLAGIPVNRCVVYSDYCSLAQAAAWEDVVQPHNVSNDDLRDMLRARFTAQDFVDALHKPGGATAASIAEAARVVLALSAPLRSSPSYEEAPF